MQASRLGRSRLVWVLGAIALLIAVRGLACDGDGHADRDTAAARDGADPAQAAARDRAAILWPTLSRVRAISLAAFTLAPGTLRLEGVARDPEHQPIAGARITLGDGARTAIAESDGTFFFDDLPAGTYALRGEQGDAYGEDLTFELTETSDPEELELRRGPTVDVLVTEPGGAPIANAHVETGDRAATSDADGHARLRGCDIGSVTVSASASGHAPTRRRVEVGDDPADTIRATFVLVPGSPITGTVIDEAGSAVGNAYVEVEDDHRDRRELLSTDEHGAWTLPDAASGAYKLRASSTQHVATADLVIAHDAAHAQTGVVVRVEQGARMHGIVVDTGGKPVAGARVTTGAAHADSGSDGTFLVTGIEPGTFDACAYTDTDGSPSEKITIARGEKLERRFVVQPSSIAGVVVDSHGNPLADVGVHAESGDPNGVGFDRTDEGGHFDLHGLPPGEYTIHATHDGEREPRDDAGLRVSSGNRKVRIMLADTATIRGRVVLDGKPVPYFGYVLSDDDRDMHYGSPAPVRDPDGKFHVTALRAGTRTLVVVGPSFLRRTISDVRVAAGEDLDLGDIAVERGRSLHGHVVDASGAPIAGAVVSIHGQFTSPGEILDGRLDDRFSTRSDARGAYVIDGITGDATMIEATTATGRALPRPLDADATEVDLEIAAIGTLAGTIAPSLVSNASLYATRVGDSDHTFYVSSSDNGNFEFEPLPAGAYEVRFRGSITLPSRRVVIVADQRTTLVYGDVAQTATLRVHWPDCSMIRLRAADADADQLLEGQLCLEDVAVFANVAPGPYRVCGDDDACETIDVPAAPEVTIEGP